MNWQYTDETRSSVHRKNENGSYEWCFAVALLPGTSIEPPDPPKPEDLELAVVVAVQTRLDTFARTRGYDGILSACTYAASKNPKFKQEADRCVDARDAHWAKCYEILAAVKAGVRQLPTLDEVLAQMPALAWPD